MARPALDGSKFSPPRAIHGDEMPRATPPMLPSHLHRLRVSAAGLLICLIALLAARAVLAGPALARPAAPCSTSALRPSELAALRRAWSRDRAVPAGAVVNARDAVTVRCGIDVVTHVGFTAPPARLERCRTDINLCVPYQDPPWWVRVGSAQWRAIGNSIPSCSALPPAVRAVLATRRIACRTSGETSHAVAYAAGSRRGRIS